MKDAKAPPSKGPHALAIDQMALWTSSIGTVSNECAEAGTHENMPWYRPRSASGTMSDKIISTMAKMIPPPAPWIPRPASIWVEVLATAQMMLPSAKPPTPARKTPLRPKICAHPPDQGIAAADAIIKTLAIHEGSSESRSLAMVGKAVDRAVRSNKVSGEDAQRGKVVRAHLSARLRPRTSPGEEPL